MGNEPVSKAVPKDEALPESEGAVHRENVAKNPPPVDANARFAQSEPDFKAARLTFMTSIRQGLSRGFRVEASGVTARNIPRSYCRF